MAAILTLIGVGIAVVVLSRQPTLVERSGQVRGSGSGVYAWLSPTEFAQFPKDAQGTLSAIRVQTATGERRPFPEVLQGFDKENRKELGVCQPSPDGTWLALQNGNSFSSSAFVVARCDNNSALLKWDSWRYGNNDTVSMAWLPDSRRWVERTEGQTAAAHLTLFSVDTPAHNRDIGPAPAGARQILGVTPDGRAVFTSFKRDDPPRKTVDIFTVGIALNLEPIHKISIRVPEESNLRELGLSPRADRLAWTLAVVRVSSFVSAVRRIAPSLVRNVLPSRSIRLSTSALDGTQWREIGTQPLDPKNLSDLGPHYVRWTPDGKRLSFLYHNALWTVPAD